MIIPPNGQARAPSESAALPSEGEGGRGLGHAVAEDVDVRDADAADDADDRRVSGDGSPGLDLDVRVQAVAPVS